eukprot:Polyplicarium_translucidae@DN3334_c0_g2_i2.p2
MAEPFLLTCLLDGEFTYRSIAEGAANFSRSATIATLRLLHSQSGILVFSAGRVVNGAVFLLMLFWKARGRDGLLPQWIRSKRDCPKEAAAKTMMHTEDAAMVRTFVALGVQKFALSEAEKFMVLGAFAPSDWGVFGLVSSLGSVAARLIFAPIEEIAAVEFAKPQEPAVLETKVIGFLTLEGGFGVAAAAVGPFLSGL